MKREGKGRVGETEGGRVKDGEKEGGGKWKKVGRKERRRGKIK